MGEGGLHVPAKLTWAVVVSSVAAGVTLGAVACSQGSGDQLVCNRDSDDGGQATAPPTDASTCPDGYTPIA